MTEIYLHIDARMADYTWHLAVFPPHIILRMAARELLIVVVFHLVHRRPWRVRRLRIHPLPLRVPPGVGRRRGFIARVLAVLELPAGGINHGLSGLVQNIRNLDIMHD